MRVSGWRRVVLGRSPGRCPGTVTGPAPDEPHGYSLAPQKKTTTANREHVKYPYRLRGLHIDHPNHVWRAAITDVAFKKGFLYLVAVRDWHSRKVLSWRLSNTMTPDFCVAALEEALAL